MSDEAHRSFLPPETGLIASRVRLEYGSADGFASTVEGALVRGGDRGATIIAYLDRGDLAIRIPREDGPTWNAVPLVHLRPGVPPDLSAWAVANGVLEKLERYR